MQENVITNFLFIIFSVLKFPESIILALFLVVIFVTGTQAPKFTRKAGWVYSADTAPLSITVTVSCEGKLGFSMLKTKDSAGIFPNLSHPKV